MSFWTGSKPSVKQYSTMDPQQIGASTSFLNMAQQGMQNPYAGFEPIEQKARSSFQQSIPSLAERFVSMSPSALRSSGYMSAMGRANAGLEESLAALKSQYGFQNRGQMMNLGQMGMQPRFENVMHPGSSGFLQQLAGPLAGMGLGAATGGMIGHGLFGRGLMDMFKGGDDNGALLKLLPFLFGNRGGQQ